MKLGLYGGGFKPFHTGHFAKLLLALDESDRVLSFFGIKKQKISKKTGKPLKTHFRKFGDGPDARDFNQEMQEKIVAIYEKALQDAYPGTLDVIPSADITPITNVHSMLDRFAYSQMTDEEKQEVGTGESIPELTYQSSGEDGGSIKIDFNDIDEVIVVAGSEEINGPVYMGAINRRAERGDSRIGEKVKELVDLGKIKLTSGTADEGRLVNLLNQYHDNATEDMVTVRGTGVRGLAGSRDVENLIKYLPNILPQDQKEEIIKILIGEEQLEPSAKTESFFMPIITDSTVLRAAARFTARKKIKESVARKKGEDHIPGLTEDMSLTFDNLRSLIDDVLSGRVEHVEEKMDGQNFTFTVLDNGEIRLFGKGVSATTLEKGGAGRDDIRDHQRWNENVKDAFGSGYDVVDKYLDGKDADLIKRFFQNGKVVVEGQVMTPANPNTIPYTENHVRFIRPFTPYDTEIDQDSYRDLFSDADVEIQDEKGREWSLGHVPKLKQVQVDASEMHGKIQELQSDIDNLLSGMDPTPQTVGEYASHVLEKYIERVSPQLDLSGLSSDQKRRALQRLATGDKKVIGKPEMGSAWAEFQQFEKMRTAHVSAAIADLEKIVQKLGSYFFDTLEFALATNEGVVAELANEVEKIKRARESDQIVVKNIETGDVSDMIDSKWATKLDTSLARVEQMDLFKKAVEGVVLRFSGDDGRDIVTKLTGMFTPVHRLVGLFRYPDRSSKSLLSIQIPDIEDDIESEDLTDEEVDAINEVLREFAFKLGWENILIEGGAAFKNIDGDSLTTNIELKNVNDTLEDFFSSHLKPAGVDIYRPIGSTGKKSKSGDLDIVIGSPQGIDNRTFKNKLLGAIQSSIVDGDAKLVGQNIAVMYPIKGSQHDDYVQIDIMIDKCPDDACWLMAGTGDGEIKGVYRNLLLSHIAKRLSQDSENTLFPDEKIVISNPGGLQYKRIKDNIDGHPHDKKNNKKWTNIGEKITSPEEILKILGINISPEEALTFRGVANAINSDPSLQKYFVSGDASDGFERLSFEEYISRHLTDDKTSQEARKAVEYINNLSLDGNISTLALDEQIIIQQIVSKILSEGNSNSSSFPFSKIRWSDKLKMFSSGKWNLWQERVSATADGGKDPEGAEKAVAAMENLIYISQNGYSVVGQEGGGILIQGKGINAKLDADEAVEYIIGIRTSEDEGEPALPKVRIRHVAGTKPYDLELAENGEALEVKKMGGKDRLSKLGSATGRVFDRQVKIIRPIRDAGQISQKFIETGSIIDENGAALIRRIDSPPEGFEIENVAKAVEMVDYFFNKIRFGNSKKELPGIMIKVEGGQLGAGMVRKIKRNDLLNIPDMGNLFDICKKVLNNTLGDYSPGKARGDDREGDSVDVKAQTGNTEFEGKVSLDYFYDELIYKLFDTDEDSVEIDPELIESYAQSIEMLSEIYSALVKIKNNQGEDVFDNFISDLHYGGFYGVDSEAYYSIPCDSDHLEVYGTTQGFRAVLSMKSIPPEGRGISSVKIKKPVPEEEVDLEVDLNSIDPKKENPDETQDHDVEEIDIEKIENEESEDTREDS